MPLKIGTEPTLSRVRREPGHPAALAKFIRNPMNPEPLASRDVMGVNFWLPFASGSTVEVISTQRTSGQDSRIFAYQHFENSDLELHRQARLARAVSVPLRAASLQRLEQQRERHYEDDEHAGNNGCYEHDEIPPIDSPISWTRPFHLG